MGGTFWFHPHLHGASTIQAGGGANGLIVVDDLPGALPEQVHMLTDVTDVTGVTVPCRSRCTC